MAKTPPTPKFAGFPAATVAFLRGLQAHNDKAWFEAHRADYEAHYLAPALAFCTALGPRLQKVVPGIEYEPRINGSLLRIHRDVRFSKDKSPYKAHLDLWFWQGDRKGWEAGGFFFRLTPERLILGTGMHQLEKAPLEKYRRAVLDAKAGKTLAALLAKLTAGGYTVGEPTRKNVPRGLPEDHARAQLLKHDGLTAMLDEKHPKELKSESFVDFCVTHYRALTPLHDWLTREVMRR